MNDLISTTWLDIGHVASLPIRIPMVTIGTGSPVLSLTCGVHGEETSGVMACYRLIKKLAHESHLDGTIRIIPCANPFAQATHSRVTLTDSGNLNRTGKGLVDGTLTERIANVLYDILRDSTLVIDLHEFDMDTPTMAVFLSSKHTELNHTSLKYIATFEPSYVWVIPISGDDSSLVSALIQSDVPGFGIETSNARVLTSQDIEKVSDGLYRVGQAMGIISGRHQVKPVKAFDRTAYTADYAGLWEPAVDLFDEIECGHQLGKIVPFPLIDEETVVSKNNGAIIQLARRQLVDTGSNLYAIGRENQEISMILLSAANNMG